MDLIIKFHPNQEADFINEQKNFIKRINESEEKNIAFPFYPIYCTLSDTKLKEKTPQEAKKIIKSIVVKSLTIQSNKIIAPATINLINEESISSYFFTGTITRELNEHFIKKLEAKSAFSCTPRIFQIANLKKTGFTYELWNPIWVKKSH